MEETEVNIWSSKPRISIKLDKLALG